MPFMGSYRKSNKDYYFTEIFSYLALVISRVTDITARSPSHILINGPIGLQCYNPS